MREHVAHERPDERRAEVLRRRTVHRGGHADERVRSLLRELGREQLDPLHRPVREVRVPGAHVRRGTVVPVHDRPGRRVHGPRVGGEREVSAPVVLARPGCRKRRVGPGRALRKPPAREERDVAVVGVEPVQRELDAAHRLDELPRRRHPAGVEVVERGGAQHFPAPGRPLHRDRDPRPTDRRVAEHRPVCRLVVGQRLIGPARRPDQPQRDAAHREALAAVEVVPVVVAERLHEDVHVVRLRGRRAPGEVRTAADDHERDSREDRAAGREPCARELHLGEELREEVPDLRSREEDRMSCPRALCPDQDRVGRSRRLSRQCAREAAVVHDDAPWRRSRRKVIRKRLLEGERRFGVVR